MQGINATGATAPSQHPSKLQAAGAGQAGQAGQTHLANVGLPGQAGQANQAGGNQSVTHAAAGAASSTSMYAHSSTTVTFVNQQVDAMLANVGQGVQDQQMLRMIIALLVLQQLLGEQGQGQGQGGGGGAAGLLGQLSNQNGGGGNGNGSASLAALSSQTTMMQVHHEQTLAYNHQSVQGASYSHYANGSGGGGGEDGGKPTVRGTDVTA